MENISAEEIKQIVDLIDDSLVMHNKWHEKLIRTLLCRLPMDESFIAEDAHTKCEFGCWFYQHTSHRFHDLPVASKIGDLHKTMHDSVRNICLKMNASGMVQEEDYDYFIRNLTLFRDELTNFRQRAVETLESITSK